MTSSKKDTCCDLAVAAKDPEAYHVEAIVSVDERGQMVLPKNIRAKFGVKPGDKLAVVTMERQGKVCCLHIFKAEELSGEARNLVRSSGPDRSPPNKAGGRD